MKVVESKLGKQPPVVAVLSDGKFYFMFTKIEHLHLHNQIRQGVVFDSLSNWVVCTVNPRTADIAGLSKTVWYGRRCASQGYDEKDRHTDLYAVDLLLGLLAAYLQVVGAAAL